MAEALSPTNTLSQEHDVQLLIASKHLEKSHSDTIRGYSSKQLEHFNHKALEDHLVGEFAVIVGDSLPAHAIQLQAHTLSLTLLSLVKDRIVRRSPHPKVKKRLSDILRTPLIALKDRLNGSSRVTNLLNKSANSLEELFDHLDSPEAEHSLLADWDNDVDDSILAMLPSQPHLESLPEEDSTSEDNHDATGELTEKTDNIPSSDTSRQPGTANKSSTRRRSGRSLSHDIPLRVKHSLPSSSRKKSTAAPRMATRSKKPTKTADKAACSKKKNAAEEVKHFCMNNCKFARRHVGEMLQCSHCAEWFHLDCVGIKKTDPVGVWPCPSCRLQSSILQQCLGMLEDMKIQINSMQQTQHALVNEVAQLKKKTLMLFLKKKRTNRKKTRVIKVQPLKKHPNNLSKVTQKNNKVL